METRSARPNFLSAKGHIWQLLALVLHSISTALSKREEVRSDTIISATKFCLSIDAHRNTT